MNMNPTKVFFVLLLSSLSFGQLHCAAEQEPQSLIKFGAETDPILQEAQVAYYDKMQTLSGKEKLPEAGFIGKGVAYAHKYFNPSAYAAKADATDIYGWIDQNRSRYPLCIADITNREELEAFVHMLWRAHGRAIQATKEIDEACGNTQLRKVKELSKIHYPALTHGNKKNIIALTAKLVISRVRSQSPSNIDPAQLTASTQRFGVGIHQQPQIPMQQQQTQLPMNQAQNQHVSQINAPQQQLQPAHGPQHQVPSLLQQQPPLQMEQYYLNAEQPTVLAASLNDQQVEPLLIELNSVEQQQFEKETKDD